MPQGVPVGGRLWVVVPLDWRYNDDYMERDGNGECHSAYTTLLEAGRACQKLNRDYLDKVLVPGNDEYGLGLYIAGSFVEYSSHALSSIERELAALGITEDDNDEIQINHPTPWTEDELDRVLAILDGLRFYEVQSIRLEA